VANCVSESETVAKLCQINSRCELQLRRATLTTSTITTTTITTIALYGAIVARTKINVGVAVVVASHPWQQLRLRNPLPESTALFAVIFN